jgi:hypothetical protein
VPETKSSTTNAGFTRQPRAVAAQHAQHAAQQAQHAAHHVVVELEQLRPTVIRAARLFTEAVAVPMALLAILVHFGGLRAALIGTLAWCYCNVALRWWKNRQLPGTMVLYVVMLTARAAIALATSSAVVFFLQPVLGSVAVGLLFLGSAALGCPVTMRLARDFVTLPDDILDRRSVRRVFRHVALVFGVSRLIDAAMNFSMLHLGVNSALLSRGVFSPVLTVATIAFCAVYGWRAFHRDGIKLRFAPAHAAA